MTQADPQQFVPERRGLWFRRIKIDPDDPVRF
jgi:hypothetical protein